MLSNGHRCNHLYFFLLKNGYEAVNYIDVFGSVETAEHAWSTFFHLSKVIADVGMQEAKDKACKPSTCMIFLGLEVNSVTLTVRIPDEKLKEIRAELKTGSTGKECKLKEVQLPLVC